MWRNDTSTEPSFLLRDAASQRACRVHTGVHAGNGRTADGGGPLQPGQGHDRRPQPLQHPLCAGHPEGHGAGPPGGSLQPRGRSVAQHLHSREVSLHGTGNKQTGSMSDENHVSQKFSKKLLMK